MRRAQTDSTSQNVRNNALNPRWETGTGGNVVVRQNLCTNPRGVGTFFSYSSGAAQVITPNVAITGHPEGITTATRFTFSSSASNPGINILPSPAENTTYVLSAWIYVESLPDTPAAGGFAENGVVSGSNYPNTVGVWNRISWVRTTTGTPGSCFGIRHAGLSGGTGSGSILVTGILIETFTSSTAASVTSFFDGASTDTSDYDYGWVGTANNSVSRELAPAPDLANSSGGANRAAYLSTDRPAGAPKFLRLITFSPGVSVALNPTDVQIRDGVPRTDLVWLRANRTMTVSMRYRNPTGSNVVAAPAANLTNQWQLYRNFQTPTGADDMALGVLASSPQAGDMIDMGPHMTVEGEYTGDIVTGEGPFSKWYGLADRSASIGYPPQLLDHAGIPETDISAVGTHVLGGGFGATEARTIYTVYANFLDIPDGNVPTVAVYGSSPLTDSVPNSYITLRQQAWTGNVNFLLARRTGGNGAGVANSRMGFNVAAWGINTGGTMFNSVNNPLSVALDGQVMSLLHERLLIPAPSANSAHVRTLVYRGYHNDTTRAAVMRYLGNKYGANVA